MQYSAKIENCAFIGDIKGNNNTGAGGIAGSIDFGEANTDNDFTIISNCYHAGGSVTGKINNSIVGRCTRYEGINNDISVKNCYSIKDESPTIVNEIFNIYEVIILSENMMRNAYNELGDAFVKNPDNSFNNGYPVFTWQIKANGDVNDDGNINIADAVMLQKWLLGSGQLINHKNADLYKDSIIDVFDLVILKQLIAKG